MTMMLTTTTAVMVMIMMLMTLLVHDFMDKLFVTFCHSTVLCPPI